MNIGEKLLTLRKSKNLSQEEVAEKLNVTRQTVSKWETDQSMPDFDKIKPLCELFEITPNELISENIETTNEGIEVQDKNLKTKRAVGIGLGILGYFIAIAWIMISTEVMNLDDTLAAAIFLIICGVATFAIIFTCMTTSQEKPEKEKKHINPLRKQINEILGVLVVIIYLIISFMTMAWHITWIIFLLYGLVKEIIKLFFMLKGDNNEE